MDNMIELFKKHFEKMLGAGTPDDEEIEKTWTQVGKLSPEDQVRRRNLCASAAERNREVELLKKKAAAIKAQMDVDRDEFWVHLHKAYGIPDGNLHLHDDGRIFLEPKDQKKSDDGK